MDAVAGFLSAVLKPRYEEDSIDRLSYQYSAWLLLAFSITLSGKEYVGSPVQCWQPAQFTDGWNQYVHDYCFVENTYYQPMDNEIDTEISDRNSKMISYYQWVPFIMALQALLFFLPHFIWRSVNHLSGLPVRALGGAGKEAALADPGEKKDEACNIIAAQIHEAVEFHNRGRSGVLAALRCRGSGIYVTVLYIALKLAFIVNLLIQFRILNYFLGPDHDFWGISVLNDLASGRDWTSNGHFPRITLCDFQVRVLGNIQRHTVQCVLMINMFNEKIFLFLWWWFALVFILTVVGLLRWLVLSLTPHFRQTFIRRLLAVYGLPRDRNQGKVASFVRNELGPDGVLVLRLLASNASELVAAQVLKAMWNKYVKDPQPPRGFNGPSGYSSEVTSPLIPPNKSH